MTTANTFPFATAELEAAALFALLTREQLEAYRLRVVEGMVRGDDYISGDCGCAYGTYLIVKGEEWRIQKTGDIPDQVFEGSYGYLMTPLECKATWINVGDTPATNEASAWLLAQVDAAIGRELPPFDPAGLKFFSSDTIESLRAERDALAAEIELLKAAGDRARGYAAYCCGCAKVGEMPETYDWYLETLKQA